MVRSMKDSSKTSRYESEATSRGCSKRNVHNRQASDAFRKCITCLIAFVLCWLNLLRTVCAEDSFLTAPDSSIPVLSIDRNGYAQLSSPAKPTGFNVNGWLGVQGDQSTILHSNSAGTPQFMTGLRATK